jgi:carbon monoxide dehydrogenase subunit G
MGSVTNEIDIDRPADEVWKLVRDFGGIDDWIPGIDACRV